MATKARPWLLRPDHAFLYITPLQSSWRVDSNSNGKKKKIKGIRKTLVCVFVWEDVVGLNPRANVDAQYDIPVGDAWCGNLLSCGYLCPRRFGIGLVILGI